MPGIREGPGSITASIRPPSFPARLFRAGINILVLLHSAILLTYYISRALGNEPGPALLAVGYLLPWFLALGIPLAMMAWVHPWRPMRWWPILPAALFIATYGTRFLPKSHLEASKAFTVVTYNVLFRNADYLKVVDNIERLNADVVALQEMEPPLVVEIEARLRDRYPYRRYTYWQVILSRYPIMEYEAFRIGGDDGLPAQRAVLDIEGRQVVFYNVHPRAPALRIHPLAPLGRGLLIGVVTEGTEKDLRLLRARLDGEALPVIVAGDLNITDQHPHYPRVRGDLRDAYLESGWGMGFTFRRFLRLGFAMWRIDYILHSRHLKSVAARTGEFGGSDHRPVIATLKFDP